MLRQSGNPSHLFYNVNQWNELGAGTYHLNDYNETVLLPLYERTRASLGMEFRAVTESRHGTWSIRRPRGEYDAHNIPFHGGILIVERPWINDGIYRAGYVGPQRPEDQVARAFLTDILSNVHERHLNRVASPHRESVKLELDILLTALDIRLEP